MHILLGGTGHVGSAVARTLLEHNQPLTIISRDPKKAVHWKDQGVTVAIADVHDTEALRAIFQTGTRLFLLNPPAAPSTDTVAQERQSLSSILTALDKSGIKKVVALSTYGAQPGEGVGDMGVLYEMEQQLASKKLSTTIIRAAYYMSNWDMSLPTAQQEGLVRTLYPVDLPLPMVSPDDIGQFAARLMMEPQDTTGLYYLEGPTRYSSADVAAAFAQVLNRSVVAQAIGRAQWVPALTGLGFSGPAAAAMAAMTDITLNQDYERPEAPVRGHTTLQAYIQQLVGQPS
ncbi:NmrA family NAD(P)-binding protein [Spirosoma sordidisoli]|uniref:NAD-dependent epimerase/dehydratase family protein n=1 Tax=Spirosoma sordidisoli TaxID=2502893 RepID=A0A4Q2UEA1_9BACT|nr:NmrA family NAD(P)-binding protein [Spirosoma sordidisoli]RYC66602.1 NAD-dependent epimerase/dehydratase family protein [Spirosoma sordidisoli]